MHGAGLVNTIFLKPNSVLIELKMYKWYKRPVYNCISTAAGVNYLSWTNTKINNTIVHWDELDRCQVCMEYLLLNNITKEQSLTIPFENLPQEFSYAVAVNQDTIVDLPELEEILISAKDLLNEKEKERIV